jgi:hypothetical protein
MVTVTITVALGNGGGPTGAVLAVDPLPAVSPQYQVVRAAMAVNVSCMVYVPSMYSAAR